MTEQDIRDHIHSLWQPYVGQLPNTPASRLYLTDLAVQYLIQLAKDRVIDPHFTIQCGAVGPNAVDITQMKVVIL